MRSRWIDLFRRVEAAAEADECRQLIARVAQDYQHGHSHTLLCALSGAGATPSMQHWIVRWLFGFMPMPASIRHVPFDAVIHREKTPVGVMRIVGDALKKFEAAGERGDDGLVAWFYELCERRNIAI